MVILGIFFFRTVHPQMQQCDCSGGHPAEEIFMQFPPPNPMLQVAEEPKQKISACPSILGFSLFFFITCARTFFSVEKVWMVEHTCRITHNFQRSICVLCVNWYKLRCGSKNSNYYNFQFSILYFSVLYSREVYHRPRRFVV